MDFRGSIAWLSGSLPTYHDVGRPSPRKARFQVLVRPSWAGFHPQGSYKRFSTHLMCLGLLFQASWHNPLFRALFRALGEQCVGGRHGQNSPLSSVPFPL